ncbi:hypothetical protein [Nitrosomonas cryotolerans]|uniref:hypothetical protein n=1 Tax=Nitrosomonas cryotolerans TaxID=44575 RepID=UPI0005623E50|nr:hypothetical protein [Nitrosomonas cryotolerans]
MLNKEEQSPYGYKDHANVDQDTKLITAWKITSAKKPVRARGEHVFGSITNELGGITIRTKVI